MIRLKWQGQHSCPRCHSQQGFRLQKDPEPQPKNKLWPLRIHILCNACNGLFIRNCREVPANN